jgi:hypothetical protein
MLAFRAVDPCRSETKYCSPAVQFLPVARKLHGKMGIYKQQRKYP